MPRTIRFRAMVCAIGLMLSACTDPAGLSNEILAVNDVDNTNMPAVQDVGMRAVGNIVLSAVPRATPSPTPTPTSRPTADPTPSPTPSGPIVLP